MSRLLFLAMIVAAIYWLLKSNRKQLPKDEGSSMQAEDMVRCVYCGVHLPKHESILASGEYFCSEAHRRARSNKPK